MEDNVKKLGDKIERKIREENSVLICLMTPEKLRALIKRYSGSTSLIMGVVAEEERKQKGEL
jgi:hypothetical protein